MILILTIIITGTMTLTQSTRAILIFARTQSAQNSFNSNEKKEQPGKKIYCCYALSMSNENECAFQWQRNCSVMEWRTCTASEPISMMATKRYQSKINQLATGVFSKRMKKTEHCEHHKMCTHLSWFAVLNVFLSIFLVDEKENKMISFR